MGGDHAPAEIVAGAIAAAAGYGMTVILTGRPQPAAPAAGQAPGGGRHHGRARRRAGRHGRGRAGELAAPPVKHRRRLPADQAGPGGGGGLGGLHRRDRRDRPAAAAIRCPGCCGPASRWCCPPGRGRRCWWTPVPSPTPSRRCWSSSPSSASPTHRWPTASRSRGWACSRSAPSREGQQAGPPGARAAGAAPPHGGLPIRFTGNIEGGDLLAGKVDVVVTDGFTGNVALKTIEGAGDFAAGLVRAALQGSRAARFGALFQQRGAARAGRAYGRRDLRRGRPARPGGHHRHRPRGLQGQGDHLGLPGWPRIWRAARSPSGSRNGSGPATGPATSCAASKAPSHHARPSHHGGAPGPSGRQGDPSYHGSEPREPGRNGHDHDQNP